tara:strand:+ start:9134 stop:9787 length:654 start_codon:yes stop_codon:yes gene_type:complete
MFPFPFSFIAPKDFPVEQIPNLETLEFNGVDTFISYPDITLSSSSYTISMWVNLGIGGTNVGYLLTNGNTGTTDANTKGFKIDESGTIGQLAYWNGASQVLLGTVSNSVNNWNHLAFVCNTSSNSITSFINGVQSTVGSITNIQNVYNLIGMFRTNNSSNPILGMLDEIAIFNREIDGDKILEIYQATAVVSGVPQTANLFSGGLNSSIIYWNRMGD